MPELTTEDVLQILIDWLCDNIRWGTEMIFDNDEDNTDSTQRCCTISHRYCRTFAFSVIFSFYTMQNQHDPQLIHHTYECQSLPDRHFCLYKSPV